MSVLTFKPHLRITLVLVPQDLRYGFGSLKTIAASCLNIDISKGNDAVVFVSKRRNICKVIASDDRGSILVTRRLHENRFQELLAKADGPAAEQLSMEEFERYFDGEKIYVKRNSLL